LGTHLFEAGHLDATKGPFRFSSQAVTYYYQS